MNFFKRLTPFGRLCIIIIVVAGLGFGAKTILEQKGISLGKAVSGNSYDAAMIIDTYTGWAPIVWGNGGLEGTKDSYFYKNFGIRLKLINMDDFEACRAAWKNGDADLEESFKIYKEGMDLLKICNEKIGYELHVDKNKDIFKEKNYEIRYRRTS